MSSKNYKLLKQSIEPLNNFLIGKNAYDPSHEEPVTFVRNAIVEILKGKEPNEVFEVKTKSTNLSRRLNRR